MNVHDLTRGAVDLVLSEGSHLEGFLRVVLKRTLLILVKSLCQ